MAHRTPPSYDHLGPRPAPGSTRKANGYHALQRPAGSGPHGPDDYASLAPEARERSHSDPVVSPRVVRSHTHRAKALAPLPPTPPEMQRTMESRPLPAVPPKSGPGAALPSRWRGQYPLTPPNSPAPADRGEARATPSPPPPPPPQFKPALSALQRTYTVTDRQDKALLPAIHAQRPPTYFHGHITRRQAEALLHSTAAGTYLVREKVPDQEYVISISSGPRGSANTAHHLIRRSKRVDLSPGRHFLINETSLEDCFRVADVVSALQRPEAPATHGTPPLSAALACLTRRVVLARQSSDTDC